MSREVDPVNTITHVTTVSVEVAEKILLSEFNIPNGALGNIAWAVRENYPELSDEEVMALALIQIAGGHLIHEHITGHLPE